MNSIWAQFAINRYFFVVLSECNERVLRAVYTFSCIQSVVGSPVCSWCSRPNLNYRSAKCHANETIRIENLLPRFDRIIKHSRQRWAFIKWIDLFDKRLAFIFPFSISFIDGESNIEVPDSDVCMHPARKRIIPKEKLEWKHHLVDFTRV